MSNEAEEFGRDVGRELAGLVADTRRKAYRTFRQMRVVDAVALVVQLLLALLGVFWPWVFGWFVVSFVIDCLGCWRLNPARRAREATG